MNSTSRVAEEGMEKVEVAEAMHHDDDDDDDEEDERESEGRGEDDGSIGSSADWPIDWDTEPEGDERDCSSDDDFLNHFFGHGRRQEVGNNPNRHIPASPSTTSFHSLHSL